MKKLVATLCLASSAFALSACGTSGQGDVDTAPPYALERTATHQSQPAPAATPVYVKPAEKVFQEAQTK